MSPARRWIFLGSEFKDLLLFLGIFSVLAVVWNIVFQWTPELFLAHGDAIQSDSVLIRTLMRHEGDIHSLLYRPEWMGGINLAATLGAPWLWRLGAHQQWSLPWISSLSVLLIQTTYAYIGLKLIRGFLFLSGDQAPVSRWSMFLSSLALAFIPACALQLEFGHWQIVLGPLVYLADVAILMSVAAGTATCFQLLITAGLALTAQQTIVQQTQFYAWTFGVPFFVAVIFTLPKEKRARALLTVTLTHLAGIALALPDFWRLWTGVHQGEIARSLSDTQMVYAYLTGTLRDWLNMLTWGWQLIADPRGNGFWHETDYPIGASLVALVLVPWQKLRWLGFALLLSLLMLYAFTTNLEPISTLLLSVIPILGSFRVPTRAMLGLALLILPMALTGVVRLGRRPANLIPERSFLLKLSLLVALLILSVMFARGWTHELLFLGTIAFMVTLLRRQPSAITSNLLLFVIVAGELIAYRQRTPAIASPQATLAQFEAASRALTSKAPEMFLPMSRTDVALGSSLFRENQGIFLGLSTLNGYSPPPSRYLQLLTALNGIAIDPQYVNLSRDAWIAPHLPVLSRLYNITSTLSAPNNVLTNAPSDTPTWGSAWFVRGLKPVHSFFELTSLLKTELKAKDAKPTLAPVIHEDVAFQSPSAPISRADFVATENANCTRARTTSPAIEATDGASWRWRVENPSDCYLIFATNYSPSLHAHAWAGERNLGTLQVFPAYGALAAVRAPASADAITLEANQEIPIFVRWAPSFGILLLCSAFLVLSLGRKKIESCP